MNKETAKILGKDFTYIKNCWEEFVKLTPDEIENLRYMKKIQSINVPKINNMYGCYGKRGRNKSIICNETGEIFKTIKDAAEFFECSRLAIHRCLKDGHRLRYKHVSFKYTDKPQEKKVILWIVK